MSYDELQMELYGFVDPRPIPEGSIKHAELELAKANPLLIELIKVNVMRRRQEQLMFLFATTTGFNGE